MFPNLYRTTEIAIQYMLVNRFLNLRRVLSQKMNQTSQTIEVFISLITNRVKLVLVPKQIFQVTVLLYFKAYKEWVRGHGLNSGNYCNFRTNLTNNLKNEKFLSMTII